MLVTHFCRKTPLKFQSLYAYFEDIRRELQDRVEFRVAECPEFSRSFRNLVRNLSFARKNVNGVNHITGDVLYLMLALPRRKTVLTIPDCIFVHNPSPIRRKILKTLWLDWPVRRALYVTAISEATKNDIVRLTGCSPAKIDVVYVTVKAHFRPIARNFSETCPRILHIGTAPNKNGLRLISALKGVRCHLVIVGELNHDYHQALESSGIEFTNLKNLSDSEMLECYASTDMLLFPSVLEGFGMPIVEANLVGRPVITSNYSSMPEIAGTAALLVDPFNVDSIREGVLKLIADSSLRQELIQNGFANARRFDVKAVAMQYKHLYDRVTQDKN